MEKELMRKFNAIKNQEWITSLSGGHGGGGMTLEKLLNVKSENFEIPDFGDIEIKVTSADYNDQLTLFSAVPDGTNLFEIKRIHQKYGYYTRNNNKHKVFNIDVYANKNRNLGNNYSCRLKIDTQNKKIYFLVCDNRTLKLDQTTYWTFSNLETKLFRKLKKLALIHAKYRKRNNLVQYNYQKIDFYELTSFDNFIKLLSKGVIKIIFKIGYYKRGPKYGQIYDHGTAFSIKIDCLESLFDKIQIS